MANDIESLPRQSYRTAPDDVQVVVTGVLKENERTEMIVFTIPLSLFEIVCIATIPSEGTTTAPVYCKFRIKR